MYRKFLKRLFDIIVSLMALPFVLLAIAVFAPIIYFTDKGPVFYNAPRCGKNGKTFVMFKLRSMKVNAPVLKNADGSTYSGDDDPRLTKVGRFIRKLSIDELPQILNVLIGDMSFVGPRPEVRKYVDMYTERQLKVLDVRPGITDLASIKYRNENDLLATADNPEQYYIDFVMQDKLALNLQYIETRSFFGDIKLIFRTIFG